MARMNFDEAAQYMGSLLRLGIKLGNDRFATLLERLGSPHKQLRVIHIAGTKGKGSTATFAASVLRAAGYHVGLYLSPYVYDLRERIQVDGEMISNADFARLVTKIKPHIDEIAATELGPTTEFELKTAVGFCYLAERAVDYSVIEVGLGGRLDATNIIPAPLVSVITNIGYDHCELLGETLGEIAAEKAGILKPHGICVTGIDGKEALDVVKRIARERDNAFYRVIEGRDWTSEADRTVSIHSVRFRIDHVVLNLHGRFQHANAAVALHAIDHAGIPVTADAARIGLERASAPGRLETVRLGSPEIVMDVAHNELAGSVLRTALIEELDAARRPLVLVAGMSRTHDPAELLGALLQPADKSPSLAPRLIIATQPEFRPRPAQDVATTALALGADRVETIENVIDAAKRALQVAGDLDNPLIVVTGSFYTVGALPRDVWASLLETQRSAEAPRLSVVNS